LCHAERAGGPGKRIGPAVLAAGGALDHAVRPPGHRGRCAAARDLRPRLPGGAGALSEAALRADDGPAYWARHGGTVHNGAAGHGGSEHTAAMSDGARPTPRHQGGAHAY